MQLPNVYGVGAQQDRLYTNYHACDFSDGELNDRGLVAQPN